MRAARAFVGRTPPRRDPFADRRDPSGPVLVEIPPIVEVPATGTGRVTLLMPTLLMARMTGGPNTALNLVGRLARHDVPLRILASLGPMDDQPDLVRAHVERLAGQPLGPGSTLDAVGADRPLEVAPDDVFVATAWPTAHIANAARARSGAPAFVYLIQDFEAAFFAHSTKYALAMATYRMPFHAVFNEALLRQWFIENRVGAFGSDPVPPSTSFEPAVDRALFARDRRAEPTAPPRRRRLLFYGRPANERNCFDLGLRALRIAVARGALPADAWEVVSIGAAIPELDLGGGRSLQPAPWMEYGAYARFVADSDVMLALMLSPHTGYPALEMAAAGGRVVTNVFGTKSADALLAMSPLIDGVEPEADAVADALVRATAGPATEDAPAPPSSIVPDSWDEAFAATIPWLLDTVATLRAGR